MAWDKHVPSVFLVYLLLYQVLSAYAFRPVCFDSRPVCPQLHQWGSRRTGFMKSTGETEEVVRKVSNSHYFRVCSSRHGLV